MLKRQSPGFYSIVGIMWSITFLVFVFELDRFKSLIVLIPPGAGAVIFYVIAILLAVKRKRGHQSLSNTAEKDNTEKRSI